MKIGLGSSVHQGRTSGTGGWFQGSSFVNWNRSWAAPDGVTTGVWRKAGEGVLRQQHLSCSVLQPGSSAVPSPLPNSRLTLQPHRCPSFSWALWSAAADEQSGFLWIPSQWDQVQASEMLKCMWCRNYSLTSPSAASLRFRSLLKSINYLQTLPGFDFWAEQNLISKELDFHKSV